MGYNKHAILNGVNNILINADFTSHSRKKVYIVNMFTRNTTRKQCKYVLLSKIAGTIDGIFI